MSFPPHRRFVKPLCGGFFIQVPFILFHLRLSLCLQASSGPLHIAKLNGRLCEQNGRIPFLNSRISTSLCNPILIIIVAIPVVVNRSF